MRRILCFVLLTAAVNMTGLLPFQSSDVASLVPVEALTVDVSQNQVVLRGGDCQGFGEDWDAALADLHQSAEGKVFLGTAEQVIVSARALSYLPDVVRCEELRPAAVLCVCPGEPPDPKAAAKYLSAHDAGVTIQHVQAAMLEETGMALPMLVNTEGGLRLYGSANR